MATLIEVVNREPRALGHDPRIEVTRAKEHRSPHLERLDLHVREVIGYWDKGKNRLYAFEWGELVRILGGFGRDGQVTPPA